MLARCRADLFSAWKGLRAAKGTTTAAIVTLALGTGANVAVVALAYSALWRPLPLTEPDRLVVVATGLASDTTAAGSLRATDLVRWREGLQTMTGLAGWATGEFTVRGHGGPEIVQAAVVTSNFFDVVGAKPAAGRLFDERSGESGVAVLARRSRRERPAPIHLAARCRSVPSACASLQFFPQVSRSPLRPISG